MELSNQEIEKIWAEKLASEKKLRERNKQHSTISTLHQTCKLPVIIPKWHSDKTIELSMQRENLEPRLLEDGFTIIENVDIEMLFDKMTPGNPEMFR